MANENTQPTPVEAGSSADKRTYPLMVTEFEAKLIMDSFKITNLITEELCYKTASLVIERKRERQADPALATAAQIVRGAVQ